MTEERLRYTDCSHCWVYEADCRVTLPLLPNRILERFDGAPRVVCITDPPYGIDFDYGADEYRDDPDAWYTLMGEVVPVLKSFCDFVVMPSCAIKRLPWWYSYMPPDWVIAWTKGSPGHQSAIGFNDWEPLLCWGRPAQPMHDHVHVPVGGVPYGPCAWHPCPKPIDWAAWLVERASQPGDVIVDPFMGSGIIGVAALATGRKYFGIERSPKFCGKAADVLHNTCAGGPLFHEAGRQGVLG